MQHGEKIITWSCLSLLSDDESVQFTCFRFEIETFNLQSRLQWKKENLQKKIARLMFL